MLNKIKSFVALLGVKPNKEINVLKPTTEQEDPRDAQSRKRVYDVFKQNQELISARALKPHSFNCDDELLCTKDDCWTFVPDQTMGEPYLVEASQDNKKTKSRRAKRSGKKAGDNLK